MKIIKFWIIILTFTFTQASCLVQLAGDPTSGQSELNGIGLTFDELQALKDGTLEQYVREEIKSLSVQPENNQERIDVLQKELAMLAVAKEKLSWHLSTPVVGLMRPAEWPPRYPYTPHFFSLWELAPQKGKGINVAGIDTGVAAFSLKDNHLVKKHRDLDMAVSPRQSYNIISEHGRDPVRQMIKVLEPYLDRNLLEYKELESNVPLWILEYKKRGTTQGLEKFLLQYGTKDVQKNGRLLAKGQQAVQEFTTGRLGLNSSRNTFTLDNLITKSESVKPTSVAIIEELLPLTPISSSTKLSAFLSHGNHTYGLMAANLDAPYKTLAHEKGIVGLAPDANVFMIKAFRNDTMASDKATLMAAIQKAGRLGAQVVNMSLKVADALDMSSPSTTLFREIVAAIPYGVAASGNNGDVAGPAYAGRVLGYPARFAELPFTVGSFGIHNGMPFIPDFSQYEPNVGPLFVAPGVDVLSAGILPNQEVDSAYLFLSGTSMSSSLISGFVALLLSEFQHDFTREQLILACYRSGFRLADTVEWKERAVLGALDMRTALFMLHVLRAVKKSAVASLVSFDGNFEKLLLAVHMLLMDEVQEFGARYLNGLSFQGNMYAFIDAADAGIAGDAGAAGRGQRPSANFYVPPYSEGVYELENAVAFYVGIIKSLLIENKKESREEITPYISKATLQKVRELLAAERVELFPDLGEGVRKNLSEKLIHLKSKN